jgi:hypothetical protein
MQFLSFFFDTFYQKTIFWSKRRNGWLGDDLTELVIIYEYELLVSGLVSGRVRAIPSAETRQI